MSKNNAKKIGIRNSANFYIYKRNPPERFDAFWSFFFVASPLRVQYEYKYNVYTEQRTGIGRERSFRSDAKITSNNKLGVRLCEISQNGRHKRKVKNKEAFRRGAAREQAKKVSHRYE